MGQVDRMAVCPGCCRIMPVHAMLAAPCSDPQGLLNISAPAADYIDLADFGLEGRW